MEWFFVHLALPFAAVLLGVAILASILMPLINSLGNLKSLVATGIGVGVLAVVFLVSWGMAGDEVTTNYITNNLNSPTMSKLVGGGLIMMFVLLIIASIGVVFSEVYKAIKS